AIKAACGAFDLGTFGVFLVIVSCGTSFGGLTGYAMNAARDTAPRLAFAILPIKGKGDADWAYGLTAPLIGPVIGALVAVALYAALPL
ncbi:MAG: aquaporin, partial [Anaerobutyricum hallii]|nr:aquaporin [Anaerobutyricum hallii]